MGKKIERRLEKRGEWIEIIKEVISCERVQRKAKSGISLKIVPIRKED